MTQKKNRKKMSKILLLHYWKLTYRSALFLTSIIIYIIHRDDTMGFLSNLMDRAPFAFALIWGVLALEMILRFIPSPYESMGCQKQFAKNYKPLPVNDDKKVISPNRGVLASALAWIALNGAIGVLFFTGVIDEGILIIIALAYSVCDMICILFFCPFQTWFMKNRCCGTCRIYNWDFLMMCTPLLFIKSWYTQTLTFLAIVLFVKWELTAHLHPERFCTETNHALSCTECEEKLCHHKTQLLNFWKREQIFKQSNK